MTSKERQQRIDELFTQAAAITPSQRDAFLDQACRDDLDGVRDDVVKLLEADDQLQDGDREFLQPAAMNLASMLSDQDPQDWEAPRRIGPYVVKQPLGEGGFGKVYLATRVDDYQQDVAIKIAQQKNGQDDSLLQRFSQERQVLADLAHENIARLLGGGAAEDGRPYFVLEYVTGAPITEYCDRHHLAIADRLKLFQQVCRAVAYAHRHGVIHRDLKPGNILVTSDGTPKLIDFGIAKLTGPASAHRRLATTRAGLLAFTPDYASPEQVSGAVVTTASDVYSLGVVLYELLTGYRPFCLAGLSPMKTERTLCDTKPPAPSKRVGSPVVRQQEDVASSARAVRQEKLTCDGARSSGAVRLESLTYLAAAADKPPTAGYAATHSATPDELRRTLAGDLDNIVLKSLHNDPERRYRSPDELADDIDRYFDGRPVRAQPDSRTYRFKKFVLRNRLAVAAVSTIVILLLVGITTTRLALHKSVHHQELAERQLALSQRAVYNLQISRVSSLWRQDPRQACSLLSDELFCPPELREFTWGFYRQLCEPNRAILRGHGDAVHCVAWSPTEEIIASAGREGTIKLWGSRTLTEMATLAGHDNWVNSLAFSPDGRVLASASRDRTVKLWHVATRKELATLAGHTDMVDAVAFSPNGDLLASASSDRSIKLWDVESGRELGRPMGHDGRVQSIAFSPDGTTLASGGRDRLVKLWDVGTGEVVATLSAHRDTTAADHVLALAFSPDGRTLASSGAANTLLLWDLATHKRTELRGGPIQGDTRARSALAFSPDGRTLASANYDKSIRLYDVDPAKEKARLDGHTGFVRSVAFSPDGRSLVSGSNDCTIRVWDVSGQPEQRTFPKHEGILFDVAFSPDGSLLASASEDETVRVWDARTGNCVSILTGHDDVVRTVVFSPAGGVLASGGFDRKIKLWDSETGKNLATFEGHTDRVQTLAFSPSGSTLASGSRDTTVKLWRVETGEKVATLEGHRRRVTSVCFSPDGRTLATASRDGTIGLWDWQTRELQNTIHHGRAVGSVAFSPDGKTLASGPARTSAFETCDGTITLWDVASLTAREVCRGHTDEIFCISYSPDGKTLVSASADRTIRLWDPLTGQERTTLASHRTWVYAARFSSDGAWLASSGENIKIWGSSDRRSQLQAGDGPVDGVDRSMDNGATKDERQLIHVPEQLTLQTTAKISGAPAISPDAQMIAAPTAQQTVLLWDVGTGARRFTLRGHRGPIVFVTFSSDGRYIASTSDDGSTRIWRTDNGRLLALVDDHESTPIEVDFSPDGSVLVTQEIKGRVVVWDIASLDGSFSRAAGRQPPDAQEPGVPVRSASDASGDSNRVSRRDVEGADNSVPPATAGRAVFPLKVVPRVPNCLVDRLNVPVFSPDGGLLSCGANTGEVVLWDTRTWRGETLRGRHYAPVRKVAFSNNGKLLASGSNDLDQPVILWDVATRQPLLTLRGHTDAVVALAFSPDDATLAAAAGSYDPTVRLWDVRSGRLIATLPGSEDWMCALAWSPDGQTLIMVDHFGCVRKWDGMVRRLGGLAGSGMGR